MPPPSATLFLTRMSVNCHGPWAVLRQLQERSGGSLDGYQYVLKDIDLAKGETRSPEFVGMTRSHSVPALLDTDGTVVWESHAIMRYLVACRAPDAYVCAPEECNNVFPRDAASHAKVEMALDWKAGTLHPAVARFSYPRLGFGLDEGTRSDALARISHQLQVLTDHLLGEDRFIGGGPYPTIADISIVTCLRLLDIDESFEVPKKVAEYEHRVRNMVPYLDKIASGDGGFVGFGLDELIRLKKEGTGGYEWDDGMMVNKNDVMDEA